MRVLRLFDPWRNRLCTCPPKYTLNPYTGCSHRCLYCYTSSFIPRAFEVREKPPFLRALAKDLEECTTKLYLSLSNSSDPYPPVEEKRQLTRNVLELCRATEMPVLILTKSFLVLRDVDLLSEMKAVVSITITTLDETKARILEPGAPSPQERIRVCALLAQKGVPVVLRVDPIIPGINDSPEEWLRLLEAVSPYVKQVVASTLKLRWDTAKRLSAAFPEIREFLPFYSERKGNSLYLEKKIRSSLLSLLREVVHSFGFPFSTCREGFPELNDTICDGSGFLSR
ncbi:SPL family radical SAM protein [Candidatus Caldatribacterium sp.]|uniref:SPL family radical SAM protein n=1 Tax=Candidatus Caldatribacterium sp. TaxID=2282143 RepID=UPI003872EB03